MYLSETGLMCTVQLSHIDSRMALLFCFPNILSSLPFGRSHILAVVSKMRSHPSLLRAFLSSQCLCHGRTLKD